MIKEIKTDIREPANPSLDDSGPPLREPVAAPDPSRTQWLNLVSVEGKSLLWWGGDLHTSLGTLADRGCGPISFVGSVDDFAAQHDFSPVKSVTSLSPDSTDIAFIRLGNFPKTTPAGEGLNEVIAALGGKLKSDGLIVVVIPEGISSTGIRVKTVRLLQRAGFSHQQYFLEDSRPRYHRAIVPYSQNPAWAVQYLTHPSLRDRSSILGRSKRWIKSIAYRSAGVLNPRYDLLILARRTPGRRETGNPSPAERTRVIASHMLANSSHNPSVVLWARPFSGKQQLFSYDPVNRSLLAIGQVSSQSQDKGGLGWESYRSLKLLSPLAGRLAGKGVTIPALLEGHEMGPMTYCVRSSVSGEDIDATVQAYLRRDERSKLKSLVREVLDLQTLVQDELSAILGDRASRIDDRYFENYLDLPIDDYHPLAHVGASMVQHGDFAPVNILCGAQAGRWGLIDWEWMRSSYPPLYDVFTFFLRVHYLESRPAGLPARQELMNSVIDSFFSPNWFSELVREQAIRYCTHYRIAHEDVFHHFIRFLLFQCGRYRHAILGYPEAITKYEEILKWSVSHRERFVCQ